MPELAVAELPILCPSIHIFTASNCSLIRSVILPNLEQVSVPGWVPDWFEEPVVADAQVVSLLLFTIKRSQCQTTLMVIILTEDVIGIARLAPALDKWVFSWQRWSNSYHDPLEQLIKEMAKKTITSIGETAFTLLPVLTSLCITVDYLQRDLTPMLYFVGELLANAIEAWLGTYFGVVVSIGLSGFELLENCVYNFYRNFVYDSYSSVASKNSAHLESYVRIVDDSDEDNDLDG
ncbi:hypothetical protein EV421DRAFT_1744233 [Armillaria borealis]|uniref:Uncharacterized protein n=1 Tax=Armillaria borealis TaxID=47425 RepID=A0AA39MDI7_9AGAR|nr:hypothetical protein EV421DRAFT_1744233 [Armillaria borealis]